jgi:chorismate-pyruvate lyase
MIATKLRIPTADGVFDPFADLLAAGDAKPAHLQHVDLRTLTPFQRSLLAIDGTVTKFVEAYSLEPVEVIKLKQEEQRLVTDHPWLEVAQGTPVVARQVLLHGYYSGIVYAYAVSLLVPNRLPDELLSQLAIEPGGIGRVLLSSQIENRREVLWYGREQLAELPEEIRQFTGDTFISRTYRIISYNHPLMVINEKFPTNLAEKVPSVSPGTGATNGTH